MAETEKPKGERTATTVSSDLVAKLEIINGVLDALAGAEPGSTGDRRYSLEEILDLAFGQFLDGIVHGIELAIAEEEH